MTAADDRHLHLAVSLDGAGWHPAAWRDPAARPTELFTAKYWVDQARTAERGLLDFISFDDSFGIQSGSLRRIDDRTDQVRGRMDASLVASLVAPATQHIGLLPTVTTDLPRAVPHRLGHLHARLRQQGPRRLAGPGLGPGRGRRARRRAAGAGRRRHDASRDLFDEATDVVDVVRRLWDSWEDDAIIKDVATGRFVDRDKLHYVDFESRFFTRQGPLDRAPAAAGPADRRRARPPAGAVRVRRHVGRCRVHHARRHRRRAALDRRPPRSPRRPSVGTGRRCGCSPTSSCSSPTPTPTPRPAGPSSTTSPAFEYRSDSALFVGTADELVDQVLAWRDLGFEGFRLRPAVTGHDLGAIVDDVVPALQRRGAFRAGLRTGLAAPAARPVPSRQPLRQERVTMPMPKPRKQIILGAHFPGVNNTSVWSDPAAESQVEFDSFVHLAQTAERGKFDFFFLAEGLRLREQRGKIHDLDVVGRPDTLTILAALAGVTTHLGLAGTLNATYHEAYELARQLATLDHLSGGRAAWNVVTSSDAFTGENFRRGGFLDYADRYVRAGEFIRTARELWDSWAEDEIVADVAAGQFVRSGPPGAFEHHGEQFDIHGNFTVPRSPQRHPVILQAGDSDGGPRARRGHVRRHLQPALPAGRRPGVLRRHQVPPGQVRALDRRAEDHPGHHVRARRHGRGRRREGPRHPPPAGQPADGDPAARAAVEPRPVGLRRRGPAARGSIPTCRRRRSSRAGPGCTPTR